MTENRARRFIETSHESIIYERNNIVSKKNIKSLSVKITTISNDSHKTDASVYFSSQNIQYNCIILNNHRIFIHVVMSNNYTELFH